MSRGDKINLGGKTLRVLRVDQIAQVLWLYGWRDVVASPVTCTYVAHFRGPST